MPAGCKAAPDNRDYPLQCPNCDHSLPEPKKWHSHTQVDIPQIAHPIITNFITGWAWCAPCNKYVAINDKLANTLYGPRLHAHVAYLKFKMGMTLGKIQSFIREQYCLEISTGELSEMIKRVASRYESAWQDIKTSLLEQPHLYADETGWRIDGDNGWLWSFANKDLSFYVIDRSRGQQVVNEVLGETYDGVLITDFYGAYNAIDCDKQKCWVHLCRSVEKQGLNFVESATEHMQTLH